MHVIVCAVGTFSLNVKNNPLLGLLIKINQIDRKSVRQAGRHCQAKQVNRDFTHLFPPTVTTVCYSHSSSCYFKLPVAE